MKRYYLHGLNKEEIIKKVEGIIALGAYDIHIVDNTHLEGEEWCVDFISYELHCPCEDIEEEEAWNTAFTKKENSDILIKKINAFKLKREGD